MARNQLPRTRSPQTDWTVFGIAAVVASAFILWGVVGRDSLASVSSSALSWLETNGGWAFVAAASGFVIFSLWLAISRYGRIPLGKDGEGPEFRTSSWVAMMFSAGMGIGLMFFGVVEPLAHFTEPPPGTGDPAGSYAAQDTAMATSLFHWTLYPWAMYAVVGLAIAYGTFRRGRSQLISAVFTPLLGERRAKGPAGKAIDILAIFATLFGSAASLGLGTLQISRGLQSVGWMNNPGTPVLIGVIAFLTFAFVASAISGVAKGIQLLSNINMVLALILAVFVFVLGPTVLILELLPTSVGTFLAELPTMAARTGADGPETQSWLASWTVFYWAWWISWTPFVGMFIARISRGRSIRQFVAGVILVPSVVSLFWFAIFGGAAIQQQRDALRAQGLSSAELAERSAGGTLADVFNQSSWVWDPRITSSSEAMTFSFLEHLPLSTLAAIVVIILVAIFFVSGADAASVVMGTLSQGGSIHPRKGGVIFWGVLTGAVAIVMLLAGGGKGDALTGLRNITIIVAAPFALVMIGLCWSLWRDLRTDPLVLRENEMLKELRENYESPRRRGIRLRR